MYNIYNNPHSCPIPAPSLLHQSAQLPWLMYTEREDREAELACLPSVYSDGRIHLELRTARCDMRSSS